jgi:hypothetical protein
LVEVHIRRDSRERLSSFFATGHAGWADLGEDIVCAAVSTLLQAALLGLTEVLGVKVDGSRKSGSMSLAWPAEARDDAGVRAIVETVARSIASLAKQYPDHISMVNERTQDDG